MSDPRLNDPSRNHASIDPNDPHPNQDFLTDAQARETRGSGAMWGWIAGIAVLALVAAFMFGGTNTTQRTADQAASPQPGATRAMTAPSGAAPAAPSPSPNNTTTGSGTTGSGSSSQ